MINELVLFHGTDGDNILSIIRDGVMRPNSNHEIFYSGTHEDIFGHGGDSKRQASFGFKARIILPAGASQRRESRRGNPRAVVITSDFPVRTEVLELYVRPARSSPERSFTLQTIRGVKAIKEFLVESVVR